MVLSEKAKDPAAQQAGKAAAEEMNESQAAKQREALSQCAMEKQRKKYTSGGGAGCCHARSRSCGLPHQEWPIRSRNYRNSRVYSVFEEYA
jgi:hypothetical protein